MKKKTIIVLVVLVMLMVTVDVSANNVTSGAKHEFDAGAGYYHSLARIDSTHFLNAYLGTNLDGIGRVLTVDNTTWTVTGETPHIFDSNGANYNSVSQIDTFHFLNAYQGVDDDGFAVVLTVDNTTWTVTSGAKHEFDTAKGAYHSLAQMDSTHFLNAYQGVDDDGFAVVLTVNPATWTISNGTKHEFETDRSITNSLIQIDSTHFLNAYRAGMSNVGLSLILIVDPVNLTVTNGTLHEFDSVFTYYPSLAQIDSTHYLNAYCGAGDDGFSLVFTVAVGGMGGNNASSIDGYSPANNSYIPPGYTGKTLVVTFSDADNDTMNVTITHEEGSCTWTNQTDTFVSCIMPITNGSVAGETYSWNVSITDGTDTTNGYYFIHVPWLTCTMNDSAPEVSCAVDGLVNTTFEGWDYPASLNYWDIPPVVGVWGLWMNTTANYTVGLSDGLQYKRTYGFRSVWTDAEGYWLNGNEYNFTLYECYENETPTGCGVGYNCSNHTCVFNSTEYNHTNGTFTLVITDLGNVSSGYTPLITAQYLNGTEPIEGATCYYTSNGFTLALDNLNEDGNHHYTSWVIIGPGSGSKSYIVTCQRAGCPSLQAVDYFFVGGGGDDYLTKIEWVNAPTETTQYTIEDLEGKYLTTSDQGISGADCDITIGLATYPMADGGGGSYSKSFSFDHIATYSYTMECSKAGYDTAVSDTITIVVHSSVFNDTDPDDVNITIVSPAESWNCSDPLGLVSGGNVAMGLACPFYNLLGAWFFGIMLFFILGMAYMKTDTIAVPAVLGIVIGGVYAMYLPSEVHAVALVGIAFGITTLLYLQFKGED